MVPGSEEVFPSWEAAVYLREGKFPRWERADHYGEKVFPGGEGVAHGFLGRAAPRPGDFGQTRPGQVRPDQASSPDETRTRSSARTPSSFGVCAGV